MNHRLPMHTLAPRPEMGVCFARLGAVALLLGGGLGWANSAEPTLALVGATVETLDAEGTVGKGVVLIEDKKITAVGRRLKIPADARVIDLSGKVILPGIIDPYHAVRLPGDTQRTSRTIIFRGRLIRVGSSAPSATTYSRVGERFYPYDFRGRPLLRSGITHLNLVASGYGQAALVRNLPDSPESMIASSDGVVFAMANNSSTALNVIRRGLAGGRTTTSSSSRTSSSKTTSTSSSSSSASKTATTSSSTTSSSSTQLWKEVREGKRPLIVNCSNAAGIQHLLALTKPYKDVQLTVVASGPSVYQTLDALQSRKVRLILTPTIDLQPNSSLRICVPQRVHAAGLPLALSLSLSASQLSASQDAPLFRLALLVRAGLPRRVALEAITKRPAEILGLEKTHGSIAVGKLANLLVFDGDPLDPASQLRQVYVEGNKIYDQ